MRVPDGGTSGAVALLVCTTLCSTAFPAGDGDTLPPLVDGKAPGTYAELWRGFDRRTEPLDVEVLKEWEHDGVVLKVVRYRVGIFHGKKAMMAGIYGYPKGAVKVPGLVQIHGGGQYADWRPCFSNAKRGYATISISWDGRISAPDYVVDPAGVQLFFDGKTDDPNYRKTTDFGGLDPYHVTRRQPGATPENSDWFLDKVMSSRNTSWFPWAMGARRAVTFLERQEEVDPDRLGVYGHSMGGKLTAMVAAGDDSIKAAVPSCGGVSDRYNPDPAHRVTLGAPVYLERIRCPIMFIIPSNDFAGHINDLQPSLDEVKGPWRATCSPHHNHWDTPEYEVATQLWFDQHLKGTFKMPTTPETELILETEGSVPLFRVRPDPGRLEEMPSLNVFYTQQGEPDGSTNYEHIKRRFWHHAPATREGGTWTAEIPVQDAGAPLWVYANVLYPLDKPISGSGYGYADYTARTYNLSSRMAMVPAGGLAEAGVRSTLKRSLVIEDFQGDWQKEWWSMRDEPGSWDLRTYKVHSPMYKAPPGARLVFEIKSEQPNQMAMNVGATYNFVDVTGGGEWQTVERSPADFKGQPEHCFADWQDAGDLCISGPNWKGPRPEFRGLRWVVPPAVDYVDGVAPGGTFRYGVHELKWVADTNGNRLMDAGEVHRKADDDWGELGEKDFRHTVLRRRTCMYLPNAYIYKKTPTRDLSLFIDFPEDWKPTDRRPAMLWFFGGAWNTGDPTAFKPPSEYFAKRGVVGICVDYRIATVDGHTRNDYRGALDGKTAVRWVRKNAPRLGIDPARIMAGGGSAGGHLAVATQIDSLNDPDDDPRISASVAALLLQSPYVVRISEECWLFQLDFATLPPVWVGYGLLDQAAYNDKSGSRREERNGESFIAALKKAGIPLRTYIKEGMNHGFCSGPHLDSSTRDIDRFLQQCGLLEPPDAEVPDEVSRYPLILQARAVDAGKAKRSEPGILEFPTKAADE